MVSYHTSVLQFSSTSLSWLLSDHALKHMLGPEGGMATEKLIAFESRYKGRHADEFAFSMNGNFTKHVLMRTTTTWNSTQSRHFMVSVDDTSDSAMQEAMTCSTPLQR